MSHRCFNRPEDFDAWLEGREPCARFRFGSDFPVSNKHVVEVVVASGEQLVSLYLGNSDTGGCQTARRPRAAAARPTPFLDTATHARCSLRAGNGYLVTDAAVMAIAQGCPNLSELALCSCTNVTTAAFAAVIAGCPRLEVLHCTGHDRSSGEPARDEGGKKVQHCDRLDPNCTRAERRVAGCTSHRRWLAPCCAPTRAQAR